MFVMITLEFNFAHTCMHVGSLKHGQRPGMCNKCLKIRLMSILEDEVSNFKYLSKL
jgi:hypothetical protein